MAEFCAFAWLNNYMCIYMFMEEWIIYVYLTDTGYFPPLTIVNNAACYYLLGAYCTPSLAPSFLSHSSSYLTPTQCAQTRV